VSESAPVLRFDLDARALRAALIILLALGAALVGAHVVVHVLAPDAGWGPLEEWADLDDDASVASWFSSLQYLAVSVTALLARRDSAHPSAFSQRFLLAVSGVALFLSADEMFGIHERVTDLAEGRDIGALQAVMINGHGAWVALYAVLALILVVAGRNDLRALWRDYRSDLRSGLLGVALLGLGEVGFEVLGYLVLSDDLGGRAYELQVVAEEWAAMAGMSLVLYCVLRVLASAQILAPTATSPDAA
jgi:hypothetical protein